MKVNRVTDSMTKRHDLLLVIVLTILLLSGCHDDGMTELNSSLKISRDLPSDTQVHIENDPFDIGNEILKDLKREHVSSFRSMKTKLKLIVLDPGHQEFGNYELEPIGPGSNELKAKVSSGTEGVLSGKKEYDLNLEMALVLEKLLIEKGYRVILTRYENSVDLSNSERAQIANENNADVFLRLHANGSDNSDVHGIMLICQTKDNPFQKDLYDQSSNLARLLLDELVESTNGRKQYVWETDGMSGINWSEVPTCIIEVGYMTNPHEEALLMSEEYQALIALGISNGLDKYFDTIENKLP